MKVEVNLSTVRVRTEEGSVDVATTQFGDVGEITVNPWGEQLQIRFECVDTEVSLTLKGDLEDTYPGLAIADRLRKALDAALAQPIAA